MKRTAIVLTSAAMVCALPFRALPQSVLEIAAGIKFCKTLTDDAQRLKCFDGLFAGTGKVPEASEHPQTEAAWSIEESKSPLDDSPQVTGTLAADDSLLVLRCKERKTDAFFGKQFSYFGSNPLKVFLRINEGKLIETTWQPSTNGQAAFAPSAVQFITALPDNGKLFIRVTGYGGKTADGEFNLGAVSALRDKIATACNWPSASTSPASAPVSPAGPSHVPPKRPLPLAPN